MLCASHNIVKKRGVKHFVFKPKNIHCRRRHKRTIITLSSGFTEFHDEMRNTTKNKKKKKLKLVYH